MTKLLGGILVSVSRLKELDLVGRARARGDAIALYDEDRQLTYAGLLELSAAMAHRLLGEQSDLDEGRIGIHCVNGLDFAICQWAIWQAGGICVPLSVSATPAELEYALVDSQCSQIIAPRETFEKLQELLQRLKLRFIALEEVAVDRVKNILPIVDPKRRAMILYTSGTTSKPKGVVSTHRQIIAQITSLIEAWQWDNHDHVPLFLPLHHIHGIINVLSCGLWSGAQIECFDAFRLEKILQRVANGPYTLFMAVPTIYYKLIHALENMDPDEADSCCRGFARMRLMVSGSAALPASVHEKWLQMTGQSLLERYGMTEIGMALSNPLEGERRPGAVGIPLPGVEIRLMSESGAIQCDALNGDEPGEIQVRGAGVFREYWNRESITQHSFDDGWFRTGDLAIKQDGYYKILGRMSIDIIKSGGYKLSALEIEEVLLEHPSIDCCAVVGIPDETWGEAVAAAVQTSDYQSLTIDSLREWCRQRLSPYKIPKRLALVSDLPRNAMGKIVKPDVRKLFSTALSE